MSVNKIFKIRCLQCEDVIEGNQSCTCGNCTIALEPETMAVLCTTSLGYEDMSVFPKLKTNKIKCRHCGDIIESKTVYQCRTCTCARCAVDGGLEYARRIGARSIDYEELSEYE